MVGGDDGSSNLHSVEYYNPTADTWTLIKTTMETARSYAGVAVIDRPKFFIQVNYKIYKILIQLLFFKLNSSNNGDCLKRMKHNSRSPIDHHRPIQRINKRIKVWQLHYQTHTQTCFFLQHTKNTISLVLVIFQQIHHYCLSKFEFL